MVMDVTTLSVLMGAAVGVVLALTGYVPWEFATLGVPFAERHIGSGNHTGFDTCQDSTRIVNDGACQNGSGRCGTCTGITYACRKLLAARSSHA